MGRRRDSHRRHRELSFDEETDLLGWGDRVFESDEAHRSAWWVHRAALLVHLGGRLPGTRPKAYWDYEPGARDERDFIGEGIDSDALWEAQNPLPSRARRAPRRRARGARRRRAGEGNLDGGGPGAGAPPPRGGARGTSRK